MTYTAYGPAGARLAAALGPRSRDLVRWRHLGLVHFAPLSGLDLAALDNKNSALFPEPTPAPDGRLALALIHRPTFQPAPRHVPERRPSMWISCAPLDEITADGWLVFYHGVAGRLLCGARHLCYRAGALLPDAREPRRVPYRSGRSILAPRGARRTLESLRASYSPWAGCALRHHHRPVLWHRR